MPATASLVASPASLLSWIFQPGAAFAAVAVTAYVIGAALLDRWLAGTGGAVGAPAGGTLADGAQVGGPQVGRARAATGNPLFPYFPDLFGGSPWVAREFPRAAGLGDWSGPAAFGAVVPPDGDPETLYRRLRGLARPATALGLAAHRAGCCVTAGRQRSS